MTIKIQMNNNTKEMINISLLFSLCPIVFQRWSMGTTYFFVFLCFLGSLGQVFTFWVFLFSFMCLYAYYLFFCVISEGKSWHFLNLALNKDRKHLKYILLQLYWFLVQEYYYCESCDFSCMSKRSQKFTFQLFVLS